MNPIKIWFMEGWSGEFDLGLKIKLIWSECLREKQTPNIIWHGLTSNDPTGLQIPLLVLTNFRNKNGKVNVGDPNWWSDFLSPTSLQFLNSIQSLNIHSFSNWKINVREFNWARKLKFNIISSIDSSCSGPSKPCSHICTTKPYVRYCQNTGIQLFAVVRRNIIIEIQIALSPSSRLNCSLKPKYVNRTYSGYTVENLVSDIQEVLELFSWVGETPLHSSTALTVHVLALACHLYSNLIWVFPESFSEKSKMSCVWVASMVALSTGYCLWIFVNKHPVYWTLMVDSSYIA